MLIESCFALFPLLSLKLNRFLRPLYLASLPWISSLCFCFFALLQMAFMQTPQHWIDWSFCGKLADQFCMHQASLTLPALSLIFGSLSRQLRPAYINHYGLTYVQAQAAAIEIPVSSSSPAAAPAPLWAIRFEPNSAVLPAELSSASDVLHELQLIDDHPLFDSALLVVSSVRGYFDPPVVPAR